MCHELLLKLHETIISLSIKRDHKCEASVTVWHGDNGDNGK
jgi:hypothetical protein